MSRTMLALAFAAGVLAPLSAWADAENPEAQFNLAQRYEHAEGVPRDFGRAIELYCEASRQGYAGAAFNLGWMFLNGRGMPRNDAVGAAWMRVAAKQGSPQAAHVLELLGNQPVVEATGCDEPLPAMAGLSPKIAAIIAKTARLYRVDPKLVLAVIAVESDFQASAVSPKNAQGLMQLMPDTAQRFGVKNVFDPTENIQGGVKYLQWLLGYFAGDVSLALAAYNAGEGAVQRFGGVPPYAETHTYLKRIGNLYPAAGRRLPPALN